MTYQRIVSLTPSITETLFAMGVENRIVGVTDACDYPPGANLKSHVCSWFNPDPDRIISLEPDLVLGLASTHGHLALLLDNKGIKCTLFNPATVEEALSDMNSIGTILGLTEVAESLVKNLKHKMGRLAEKVVMIKAEERLTVSRVLDIDGENLIVAGPKSFQYDVIEKAGGKNVTSAINEAYPKVPFHNFRKWNPDMIFLCGTDQSYISRLQADPLWKSLSAVRNKRIYLFDCGLTCRTGPRIVDMVEILFQTLYV